MRRDVGSAAGLLAILAVALHTAFPNLHEGGGVAPKADAKPSSKGGDSSPKPDEPAEGPWLATRIFFAPDNRSPLPTTDVQYPLRGIFETRPITDHRQVLQLRALFGIPPKRTIYTVVATIPDPLHTRLALSFDIIIDAIERAAEAQGWSFARQWLPWLDPASGPDEDISERRHQRRLEREQEMLPGLLVFRHRDTGNGKIDAPPILLVFLVPESPTGGIAGDSLYAALNFSNLLPDADSKTDSSKTEIGLLVPTFSGSFVSLRRLLQRWMNSTRMGPQLHKTVFGGSISLSQEAASFSKALKLEFRSGIVNSSDYRRVFECEILPHYRLPRNKVAYMTELESGFSEGFSYHLNEQSCGRHDHPIQEFRFPRDLAHLRNAYREVIQTQRVLPGVDFTLKDPTRAEDSIPSFSDNESPIEQSASLDLIVEELRHERIRLVYLTATNELDLIFVARLLRRQIPDTRIIIGSDPDVLFVSAAAQDPLAGVMFLSTYPMFYHGDSWFEPGVMNTPQSSEHGLFNTAQLLLSQLTGTPPNHLRAYARLQADGRGRQYPGLWLLTLTRSGFLPVDWFNAHEDNSGSNRWFETYPDDKAPQFDTLEQRFEIPEPSFGWYVTTIGSAIIILISCFCLIRSNFFSQQPLWLALADNYRCRNPALLGACLSSSALEWILIVPALHISEGAVEATRVLASVGAVAPVATWATVSARAWRTGLHHKKTKLRDTAYLAAFVLFYLFILGTWAWACGGLGRASTPHALMFRFRALQLYSGASPALPLVLLSSIFATGFAGYFYRFTQAGISRPVLSALTNEGVQNHYRQVESYISAPMRLTSRDLAWRLGVCCLAVGISALVLWKRIYPFEFSADGSIAPFNWALSASVSVLACGLTAGCYDMWFTWRNFQRVLSTFKFIPLDDAFARVARSWPRRPIWAFWRSVSQESLAAEMMRALHNRREVASDEGESAKDEFENMREAALLCFQGTGKGLARLKPQTQYQSYIARLAKRIVDRDLSPHWKEHSREKAIEAGGDTESRHILFMQYSADFVALQYCNYIVYTARQIQNIAWGVVAALLMLIVVLNSYPLQAPLVVGRFVTVVFLLVGLVVASVFAGMERNATLSLIARSKPGELNAEFWVQIIAMGSLPTIAVLSHLFPSVASFLSSWVAPSLDAIR